MKDILDARNEINEIDKQMAQLFQKRMEAVKDVAVYKKDNGLSVRDLSREAEVAKRNSKFVTDESLKPYLVSETAEALAAGDKIQLVGFGTFEVRKKAERISVSPTTKQRMLVPPKLVLTYRPSTLLKEKFK